MSQDLHRTIGQVEGRVTALERKVDGLEERIEKRLDNIDFKLTALNEALNMGKGSWKAFAVVGAIITVAVTVANFILDLFP